MDYILSKQYNQFDPMDRAVLHPGWNTLHNVGIPISFMKINIIPPGIICNTMFFVFKFQYLRSPSYP
jgi:hypothetical protein